MDKRCDRTNEMIERLQRGNSRSNGRSFGFGLLEVLISVGILALVTGGVIGLGNISVKNSVISADRTVAYNLAQEGQEALKQIRDSKWVDQEPNIDNPWNNGFTDTTGTYYIKKDNNGFGLSSNSSDGEILMNKTTYTRSVNFPEPDADIQANLLLQNPKIENTNKDWLIKATITVKWIEYDKEWSVVMPVYFTDWMSY